MRAWLCLVLLWCWLIGATCAAAAQPQVIDDFTDLKAWRVITSDGVKMSISPDRSGENPAMRIDFEFVSGAGFGIVQRDVGVPLDLPENYEFTLGLRGACPVNDLEFKLLDAPKGENVWWNKKRAFEFPEDRTLLRYRKRDIAFAWGPSGGKPLAAISKIEFAIASSSGGKGSVWIDSLTFRALPPVRHYEGRTTAKASSEAEGHTAILAMDGDAKTAWRSAAGDATPTVTIDFGAVREFGGLTIDWDPEAIPSRVKIETSADGDQWQEARKVLAAKLPKHSSVQITDAEARFVRLTMTGAAGEQASSAGIAEVRVEPLEFGRSLTETWKAIAAEHPRGHFPRYFTGEQSFWTVTGVPGGSHEALINEEGMIEITKGGASIEPFIRNEQGQLLTWASGANAQRLTDFDRIVPVVERTADDLMLSITIAPVNDGENESFVIQYVLANRSERKRELEIFFALRPFQVNPPWQFLNTPGGAAPVSMLRIDNRRDVIVNFDTAVLFAQTPNDIGAAIFSEGEVMNWIANGGVPERQVVSDLTDKGASAAAKYRVSLKPGEKQDWWVGVMPGVNRRPEFAQGEYTEIERARLRNSVLKPTKSWRDPIREVQFTLPADADTLKASIRANLGYILVNMDGPGFQPGSRSYERSWIRDGSMTGAACLEFGLTDEPRKFVEWYQKFQFPTGKVPCVVDKRGPDPVPENDSHGQLIYAVAEVFRYTSDGEWLRARFPAVKAAVKYIEELRAQRMVLEFQDATKTRQEPGKAAVPMAAFYGLVPESISHEGYSAKPMHSYWDQFFILKGLKDAAFIAESLHEDELAKQWGALAADFRKCLLDSIRASMKAHGIEYIPGCVELGDFDATSTAVAITVCGELDNLPREWLDATFDRYWAYFVKRRDDPKFDWIDYTPYELRVVGAMVMLGHRERAMQMLDWFMKDQLPAGWHHWAEIVHKDRRTGKWIGDMPHTWVGSDFLRSVRSMFVYEDGPNDSLVLLAGVPQKWLDAPDGIAFDLPTHGPNIKLAAKTEADGWTHMTIDKPRRPIDRKIWIRPPSLSALDRIRVNGAQPVVRNGMFKVDTLPASIVYIR